MAISNNVQIVDPLVTESWDSYILSDDNCSLFNSAAWARVLVESYRYTPLYFTILKNNTLTALMPFMEVDSIITGKRGVSLPFSDFSEPIIPDNGIYQNIIDAIIEYGKKAKWRTAEFRTGSPLTAASHASAQFLRHILKLLRTEEEIFASFKDATKRSIKKAQKSGVEITMDTTEASLDQFCRLNCITRKEHGLPPQPYRFFRNILKHVLEKGFGTIALASYEKRVIAAAIYFQFNGKAMYKYGASDRKYQHLRANNLVMWEAIKRYHRDGCRTFDFGRTEPENTGLLQFKRGWGASESIFQYYKYDFRAKSFVVDPPKVSGPHNNYFRRMPIPVLKFAGSLLYRHVG